MTLKRIIYLTLILLGITQGEAYAQTEKIQGQINQYASVQSILAYETNNVDSVVVSSLPAGFGEGDTVMIYCVQGAEINLDAGFEGEDAQNPRNTGKYAFLIINEIIGNTVVFNATVQPEIKPMGPGEVAQLIRVPSYHRAQVNAGGVIAPAWDGNTGGVVTMFVRTALELNGDIDVSQAGFRGAKAEAPNYIGDCSSTDPDLYDDFFYLTSNNLAGLKGEGTTDTSFAQMRGKGMNINGGGGGNGRLSGGGGGGNFSAGGLGGDESTDCDPGVAQPGGVGGVDLGRSGTFYYTNFVDPSNRHNRIFFGGGGGTGTVMSGRITSSGGDGGGLVVIVADTIEGNNHWIHANGESVGPETSGTNGAGGGGGAGGAIILDVSGYRNNLNLSAHGGNGGNTNHATDTTGPGGGGGGGIFWLAGSAEPEVNPDEGAFGMSGNYLASSSVNHGAADGAPPSRKDGLEAPLRGFLFNSVPSEFWVCSDVVPETINASKPKGGSGTYSYQWVDSSSTQNSWQLISGATDLNLSFTVELSDTTYFRRIVKEVPQVLDADTSFRIAVYVHQAITNNTISAPDTVCMGNIPEAFVSVGLPGSGLGPGSYTYLWQKDEGSGYIDADGSIGSITGTAYQPPAGLDLTTTFTRLTTSGVCVNRSNELLVTVLSPITGNVIADYDTICWNTSPDLITQKSGEAIGGGNFPADMRYQWESGPADSGPWAEVSGATVSSYQPGALTATIWYRRVALSGNGDACKDTSELVEILNVPVITGNEIVSSDQTICTDDQPALMQGSAPGGGLDGYVYLWESSTASTGWVPADPANGNDQQSYTPPVMSGDTTIYRRVVSSGGQEGVCKDISVTRTINVLDPIVNNEIMTDVTVNCQFDPLADLIQDPEGGSEPGGGATENGVDPTRNYRWEQSTGDAPGTWTEISYGPTEKNYTGSPELSSTDDYWYRRVILSGPDLGGQNQVCSDYSDPIHITIHTAISNNEIDKFDSVCFNTEKTLYGATPAGEGLGPFYSWKDAISGIVLGTEKELPYTFSTPDARQINRIVSYGECEEPSDTLEITVMELPAGILSGDFPKACEKDVLLDVDLNMDGLTNYMPEWWISLSDEVNEELTEAQPLYADGTVEVNLSTEEISTQYNYTIGKLIYTLTDGTVCAAPDENMSGIVPIEVFLTPNPKITVTTEITDDAVCDNEVALTVDPDNGTGRWESNYPDDLGFLNDPQDLSVRASIDPDDSQAWLNLPYSIYFRSEAGDCAGTDTVKISFYKQPDPANAGSDDTIYLRNSTWLNADSASAGEGTWTTPGSGEFEDEHDPKSFVYNLDKGAVNEFTWTLVNGVCVDEDDRSVIAQDEAQAYEGFSPNGDMINDYFIVRGLADATEFSITFFNALGRSVRTITQEDIEDIEYDPAMIPGGLRDSEAVIWDGTAQDNETIVPAGTYYYVISIMIEQVDDEGNIIDTDKQEEKHYIVVRD